MWAYLQASGKHSQAPDVRHAAANAEFCLSDKEFAIARRHLKIVCSECILIKPPVPGSQFWGQGDVCAVVGVLEAPRVVQGEMI